MPRTRAVSQPSGLSAMSELVLVLPRCRAATAPVETVAVEMPKIRPKNDGCWAVMITCTAPWSPASEPAVGPGGHMTCIVVPPAAAHALLPGSKKPFISA